MNSLVSLNPKEIQVLPGRQIKSVDLEILHKNYQKVYLETTGIAWDFETFSSKASNWIFYGNAKTYIAVRLQHSGGFKLAIAVGNPDNQVESIKVLIEAFSMIINEKKLVWALVDYNVASLLKKLYLGFYQLDNKLLNSLLKEFQGYPPIIPKYSITAGDFDIQSNALIIKDESLGGKSYLKYFLVTDTWIYHTIDLILRSKIKDSTYVAHLESVILDLNALLANKLSVNKKLI